MNNRIKVLGGLGLVMSFLLILFCVCGSWYVKNSMAIFSFVWMLICVATLIKVNNHLKKNIN